MKRCCTCKTEKALDEFYRNKASPDGHARRCKLCQMEAIKRGAGKRTTPKNKRCSSCDTVKAASSFHADATRANGLAVYCKACQNDGRHQRRQAVSGWRTPQLKALYGLTPDAFASMVKAQDGKCGVCRKPPTDSRTSDPVLQVDHDHSTGKIRGLLCGSCNRAIGLMKDDPRRLLLAARYLMGKTNA